MPNFFYSLNFSHSSLWTSTHMSWMFPSFLTFSVYFLNSRISGFFVELRWFSFLDSKGLSYQLIFLSFLLSILFLWTSSVDECTRLWEHLVLLFFCTFFSSSNTWTSLTFFVKQPNAQTTQGRGYIFFHCGHFLKSHGEHTITKRKIKKEKIMHFSCFLLIHRKCVYPHF